MSKAVKTTVVLSLSCFVFFKCDDHRLEKVFFDQPPETRIERLRKYSLADQYKIFLRRQRPVGSANLLTCRYLPFSRSPHCIKSQIPHLKIP